MRTGRRMLRPALISVGLALVAPLLCTAAASAAAPEQEWVTLDDTFTWDSCGFPVVEHDTGRLHFVAWYDGSGVRQRQLVAAPAARSTYTNPSTGLSVTSGDPFVVHKRDNPDGSSVIAFTGLRFALRSGGSAFVDSGRDLIVFSDGGITLLSSVGPSTDLCQALMAAIA